MNGESTTDASDETGGEDGSDAPDAGNTEAPGGETPLELRDVVKEYDSGAETVRALKGVDFSVERGEFVSVIGPSGSGKSTMLNMLGLLDTPTSGEVLLDGVDAATYDDEARTDARREYVGFVFQQFYLIDALTAVENVALPTVYQRDPTATRRARDLLRRVGLGDRLDHRPTQLSGGQKQRVAIARSLINEPAVVLADEPTGNLDRDTGRTILTEFEAVCDRGVAVVTVTHDPLVTDFADRAVELVDGRIRDDQ
ncbi:MAG: ABC transporter ATP-binding protein [Haloglomus sp.]